MRFFHLEYAMSKRPLIYLSGVAALLLISNGVALAEPPLIAPKPDNESSTALIDSWHSTHRQKSLVVSIRPGGWALVMWIKDGQYSIDHVPWKPLENGVLIQDVPSIRLWTGRHDQEVRAELEQAIPGTDYDPNEFFRQRFMMRRVVKRKFPQATLDRPLPATWTQDGSDKVWDNSTLQQWMDAGNTR